MDPALFEKLVCQQGILVLERIDAGVFRLVGEIPSWCAEVLPEGVSGELTPQEFFGFLECFLPDAELFWAEGGLEGLKSGIWSQPAADGSEQRMSATAYCISGQAILLIQRVEREFEALYAAYQKGRNLLLSHERLLSETSKKEILLHCIVHDLAGPLSGINGVLQVLETEALSVQARKFVELGRGAVRQQTYMIDDLLATFRAETGALDQIDTDPANAPDVVDCARRVLDSLLGAFTVRQITWRVDVDPGFPARVLVLGEKERLERVFHNLIQNALRHSPTRSEITVSFRKEHARVKVTVEDEGAGVAPEIMPRLFQQFSGGGRNRGKSGLGLYSCRITVEQWKGEIGCERRSEGGARFWFRLNLV